MANNFLSFGASGSTLNVMSDAEYSASNGRAAGFGVGYADQRLANKAWLQASVAISALMKFTSDWSNQDALDSLPVATLENNFYLALANGVDLAGFGVSTGTDTYAVTLTPARASFTTGNQILVFFNSPNTTTTPTLNVNGLGASPVVKQTGGALLAGDLSGFVPLIRDGNGKWRFNGLPQSAAGRIIAIQQFTVSGTYTPTVGMSFIDVQMVGGGGAGAGGVNPSAGNVSLGSPGGGASWARGTFTAAQVGASKTVTLGAGGTPTSGIGGSGGTSNFGGLMTAPGGQGGLTFDNGGAPAINGNGALSLAPTGANIAAQRGNTPGYSQAVSAAYNGLFCGPGGDTPFGRGVPQNPNSNGAAGTGYGSGGSGVALANGGGPALGGAGAGGYCLIIEYGA